MVYRVPIATLYNQTPITLLNEQSTASMYKPHGITMLSVARTLGCCVYDLGRACAPVLACNMIVASASDTIAASATSWGSLTSNSIYKPRQVHLRLSWHLE